jgi:hypothetical protein
MHGDSPGLSYSASRDFLHQRNTISFYVLFYFILFYFAYFRI